MSSVQDYKQANSLGFSDEYSYSEAMTSTPSFDVTTITETQSQNSSLTFEDTHQSQITFVDSQQSQITATDSWQQTENTEGNCITFRSMDSTLLESMISNQSPVPATPDSDAAGDSDPTTSDHMLLQAEAQNSVSDGGSAESVAENNSITLDVVRQLFRSIECKMVQALENAQKAGETARLMVTITA